MRLARPPRWTSPLKIALAAGVLFQAAGCGGGSTDQSVVQVDEGFSKKTNTMLEKMSKDQMEKYKKAPRKR